jgi:hypothetical protein
MRQAVPDRGAIMKTLMTDFPSPAFRQMAYLIYTGSQRRHGVVATHGSRPITGYPSGKGTGSEQD